LTKESSFSNLGKYLEEVQFYEPNLANTFFFLIGMKGDLVSNVSIEKITQFAVEKNLPYFQLSSKTGEFVEECMDRCVNHIIENIKKQENESWCDIL
jgi:GTPase involved in cell partitioning and DNA repair